MPRGTRAVSRTTIRLDAAERRAEVVRLRRLRHTFDEIGAALKPPVSAQRAYQLYRQALAAIPAAQVDEHRAEELALIDDAVKDLLRIAYDHTDPGASVDAWNAINKWAVRKAKLLGLDSPTKVEVVTIDAIEAEIARLRAEMEAADDHAGATQA